MDRNSVQKKLLIEKVKEHPEIWSYKKNVCRGFVAKIWFAIAEELGVKDPMLLRKQWKNLKDSLKKEVKKSLETNSNTYPYVSQWKFYEELSFLKEELVEREKSNSFNWPELEAEESGTDSDSKKGSDIDEPPSKDKKKKGSESAAQINSELEPSCSSSEHGENLKNFNKMLERLSNVSELVEGKNNKESLELKSGDILCDVRREVNEERATAACAPRKSRFAYTQRNSALTKLFIEKIKAHPEIWSSKKDVNRGFVTKTWCAIAEEFGVEDPMFLKKRWRNLKDTFKKEMKKSVATSLHTYPYISQWKFYENLSFLKEELIDQDNSNPFNWVELEADVRGTDSDSQKGSDFDEPPRKVKKKMASGSASFEPEPSCSTDEQDDHLKNIGYILEKLSNVSELVDKKITKASSESKSEDMYKNDPDYLFLISILPTIKRMSEIQKFQFRGKINDWLLEALTQNEISNECDIKLFLHERDHLSNNE